MKKIFLLIMGLLPLFSGAEKIEATWFGLLNAGVSFERNSAAETRNLDVYSNQGSFIGLEAYSGFPNFYAKARIDLAVNPTAIGGAIATKQGFVELGQGQGAYRLGSMMTLQGQLLASPVNIMNSQLSMQHLALTEYTELYKSDLFQVQFPFQGFMTYYELEMNGLNGEVSDDNESGNAALLDKYTLGVGLVTEEGKIVYLNWHDVIVDASFWALNLDYVSAKTKIAVSYIKGNKESSLDTALAYLLGGVWLKNTVHSVNFEQTSMLLGADYLVGEQAVFYFDYNHLFDSQGHQFFALGLRLNF